MKIQLSYTELYSARQHAEKIYNQIDKLFKKYDDEYDDFLKFNGLHDDLSNKDQLDQEDQEYLQELLKRIEMVSNELIGCMETLQAIDNRFMTQVRYIEHQIDANFPIE